MTSNIENIIYWRKRAEEEMKSAIRSAEEIEKELKKAYEEAMLTIENELLAFYQRYGDENGISLAEAKQRLVGKRKNDFTKMVKEYAEYVKTQYENGIDISQLSSFEELAKKINATRLEDLLFQIKKQITEIGIEEQKLLEEALANLYEDVYYENAYYLQKSIGVEAKFNVIPKDIVKQSVKREWLGSSFSDRIWTDKDKLISILNQLIPQSFIIGSNPEVVAEQMSKKLNASYKSSVRLARTEMNHICNDARIQLYKDANVEAYRFVATLDTKTSEICREMDGTVINIEDAESGVNLPPLHPNCRSTTIPETEYGEIEERVAKDPETGKRQYVPGSMTYKQWAEENFPRTNNYRKRVMKGENLAPTGMSTDVPQNDQVFVIADEKIKKKLKNDAKELISKLSKDERKAIESYYGSQSSVMNGILRGTIDKNNQSYSNEIVKLNNLLKKALSKNDVGVDIKVMKALDDGFFANYSETLNSMIKDGNFETAEKVIREKFIGKVFADKGFMSTSLNGDFGADNKIRFEIDVPKESNGAYIEDEEELLLNADTALIVNGVRIEDGKLVIGTRAIQN